MWGIFQFPRKLEVISLDPTGVMVRSELSHEGARDSTQALNKTNSNEVLLTGANSILTMSASTSNYFTLRLQLL